MIGAFKNKEKFGAGSIDFCSFNCPGPDGNIRASLPAGLGIGGACGALARLQPTDGG